MLKLDNVDVAIQSVQILRRVSLELPTGSMAGLIGRNGAGKTTLMKSIMGILKVSSGAISFDGTDLLASPTWKRTSMGIGYMPEDRRLIPDLTVEENLLLPSWAAKRSDGARAPGEGLPADPGDPRLRAAQGHAALGRPAEDGGDRARADVRREAAAAR